MTDCRYCDDIAISGSDRCAHHFKARTTDPHNPRPSAAALFGAQEAAKDLLRRLDEMTPSAEVIDAIRDACSSCEYSPCMSHTEINTARSRMRGVHLWLQRAESAARVNAARSAEVKR